MEPLDTISSKFKRLWKYYIFQTLLAVVAIFILTVAVGKDKMVLISAMAATCFIVFALPTTVSAKAKIVIGSHIVGLLSGGVFCLVALPYFVEYPLAVGVAIFLMVALDVEHPPAAGTALAVVINEVSFYEAFIIIASAVLLSLFKRLLKPYLKNLI